MVSLNSANNLGARVENITGVGGAPRISGLRVRPPAVSQEAYALSTMMSEPESITVGAGLVISRPVTDDMACQQLADRVTRNTNPYVEQSAGLPKDMPAWLRREAELADRRFEDGPKMDAEDREIMVRQAIAEFNEGK